MKNLNKIDLELIYLKAKAAYTRCISMEENEFLSKEIGMSTKSLILQEESVCIKHDKDNRWDFVIEVKLRLLSQNEDVIGYYFYYEDDAGVPKDDKLVFE